MRGLFLRLYAALTAVLVVGLLLAGTLREHGDDAPWDGAVTVFSGFPARAAATLGRAAPAEQDAVLAELAETVGQPVRLVPREALMATLADTERAALQRGEPVTVFSADGALLHVPLAGQPFVASMGPVVRPEVGPPLMAFVLVGVLVGLALLVAMWLLPLDKQLTELVGATRAFGGGQLDARSRLESDLALSPLSAAFDGMADRVQAAIKEREALVRDREALLHAVSHELRSPLQRMRFSVELLDGEPDGPGRTQRLRELEGDIDQLDALVGELLAWARAGAVKGEPEDIDLVGFLEDHAERARRLRPGLEVTVKATGQVTAVRRDLDRAVGNLVSNAARWASTRVLLHASADRLQVHDDGPGVPQADQERIFEPFVRLDPARTQDAGGAGLGLALVARIAEGQGAVVSVSDSQPLGGACFTWRS
mgnify:CR=1 FL=1